MERCKNDVPDSSQISASVVNGEESRRPTGLPIRVRGMDCVLADIQAQIQMLGRERTYLRLVRGELAGRKPSKAKGFFTLHHLIEGAGSWPVHSESTSLETSIVTGEVKGSCADGQNMESGIRTSP